MRTPSSSTTDPIVNGVTDVATTKIKVVDDEDDALRLKPRYKRKKSVEFRYCRIL